MKKNYYVYNEHTLSFDKVEQKGWKTTIRISAYGLLLLACASIGYGIYSGKIAGPNERFLNKELTQMERHYDALTSEINHLTHELDDLHQKDNEVHRMIFGMSPMDSSVWESGTGGSERFKYITKYQSSSQIIENSLEKVDKLKRQVELQKLSMDTLMEKAIVRENKLASIPSIKPVQENKLKRKLGYLSGYGFRIHPVHKVKKFHHGIDFTCAKGTAIQATGNGVIKKVEKRRSGYGNNVVIDHGFGYETLYAHMKDIDVKVGEKVTKGQKIGTVGSSGLSTAPHLHYEVHINGKSVNPIDYCMDGLTTEEYRELVEKSAVENQSFD